MAAVRHLLTRTTDGFFLSFLLSALLAAESGYFFWTVVFSAPRRCETARRGIPPSRIAPLRKRAIPTATSAGVLVIVSVAARPSYRRRGPDRLNGVVQPLLLHARPFVEPLRPDVAVAEAASPRSRVGAVAAECDAVVDEEADTRLGGDLYRYGPSLDRRAPPAVIIPLAAIHAVACMQPLPTARSKICSATSAAAPGGASSSANSHSQSGAAAAADNGDGGEKEEDDEEEAEETRFPHLDFWRRFGVSSLHIAYCDWQRLASPQSAMDFYFDTMELDAAGDQVDPFAPVPGE